MKKSLLCLTLLMAITPLVHADDAAIQNRLKILGLEKAEIHPSPVSGLKTVLTDSGVLYLTEDGHYVIQGQMYDVTGNKPVSVTNQMLIKKMDALVDEMIIYKAAKEKHVVTIFTDITCGYCRKLHEQMKEYNDLGITIRYLAFPRQGLQSPTEKDMASIWCAADRNKAFDAAMKGEAVSPASCNINIAHHYTLGMQFGVQGTPALVLENGTVIPGYQTPQELLAGLNSIQAPSPTVKSE